MLEYISVIIAGISLLISGLMALYLRRILKPLGIAMSQHFSGLQTGSVESREINKYKNALIEGATQQFEANEPVMALVSKMAKGWIADNLEIPETEVDMGLLIAAANQLMNDPKYANIIKSLLQNLKIGEKATTQIPPYA